MCCYTFFTTFHQYKQPYCESTRNTHNFSSKLGANSRISSSLHDTLQSLFFSFSLFLLNQQLDIQSNVKRKQILFEGVNCRHYHTCLFTLQFCSFQHNKTVVSFKKPHSSSIDAYDLANLFLYLLFSWLSLIDSFLYAFFGKHRVWTLNRYGSSS